MVHSELRKADHVKFVSSSDYIAIDYYVQYLGVDIIMILRSSHGSASSRSGPSGLLSKKGR